MPSVNDNFADAIEVVIPTNGATYTSPSLSNADNTTEASEPAVSASAGNSMWWEYTPISSGTASVDTILSTPDGSGTDTMLAIWTGTALNNLVNVASDDDTGGSGTSLVSDLTVTSGTTYWIQVGSFGLQTFNVVLRVTGPATTGGGGGDGSVTAVPATATATAVPPVVSGGGAGSVTAVPATATAQAEAPVTEGETIISGGGPATATATAHPPVVSGSSSSDGTVVAVPATATAAAQPPAVSGGGSSEGGQGFLNAWYSDGTSWVQV